MPELHSAIPPLPLLLEGGQHRQQCSSVLALPCLATFQTSQHIVINTLEPAYNQRVCDFKCWTEFRQRGRDWCRNSNNFTTGVKQRQLNPTGHYQVPSTNSRTIEPILYYISYHMGAFSSVVGWGETDKAKLISGRGSRGCWPTQEFSY